MANLRFFADSFAFFEHFLPFLDFFLPFTLQRCQNWAERGEESAESITFREGGEESVVFRPPWHMYDGKLDNV